MRILFFWVLIAASAAAEPRSLFYLTDSAASLRSFYAHAAQIDIVAPAWYRTNALGVLSGVPHPRVMQAAHQAGVAVMPLVVNPSFRGDIFHQLANTTAARRRLIASMIAECRKNRYTGFQLDFEGVGATDRQALTRLVTEAAEAFHAAGYQLSLAAIPRSGDRPQGGSFGRHTWSTLQGAYDVAALGAVLDFLTWMTYDQHMRLTTPGPIAGYPWVEAQLQYLLKTVAKSKISLGIPQYGRRWYSDKAGMRMATLSYQEARALAAGAQTQIEWDARERAPWFHLERDSAREYVFFSDARSFIERRDLAERNGLHSISVWVLGLEDPAIWNHLPPRPRRVQ